MTTGSMQVKRAYDIHLAAGIEHAEPPKTAPQKPLMQTGKEQWVTCMTEGFVKLPGVL